jgi:hypothetical protein
MTQIRNGYFPNLCMTEILLRWDRGVSPRKPIQREKQIYQQLKEVSLKLLEVPETGFGVFWVFFANQSQFLGLE